MRHSNPKVLIISSDTGGGHRSAAQNLADGLHKFWNGKSIAVRIVKAVEESHRVNRKMVGLYNWILKNKQHWMKYYYWFINKFRPEKSPFFLNRCIVFCKEQFEKWFPHMIISVHPMTQHIFAQILKELNLLDKIPLVTVVTDPCYGFWKGWACEDVSLYLVANEEAKRQLIDYGISSEKIKISGMPINPKFNPVDESDAREARKAFGLDEKRFTVFVNAGYYGGGNIPQIFRELINGELDVQAIFLAGKNDGLRKKAEQMAKTAKFPVKVIGYSTEIERIMQSANVMVSKLGGLTTFEALACHLPIIADITTPPMPQEAGTVSLISRKGAGVLLKKASDIVPTVQTLLNDLDKYSKMCDAALHLSNPDSTKNIIKEITVLLGVDREASQAPSF